MPPHGRVLWLDRNRNYALVATGLSLRSRDSWGIPDYYTSGLSLAVERRFKQNASPRTTRPKAPLLERRSLVAVVFCRQLWWCSDWHPQGVHRAAKEAALAINGGLCPRPAGRGFTPPRITIKSTKKGLEGS